MSHIKNQGNDNKRK